MQLDWSTQIQWTDCTQIPTLYTTINHNIHVTVQQCVSRHPHDMLYSGISVRKYGTRNFNNTLIWTCITTCLSHVMRITMCLTDHCCLNQENGHWRSTVDNEEKKYHPFYQYVSTEKLITIWKQNGSRIYTHRTILTWVCRQYPAMTCDISWYHIL